MGLFVNGFGLAMKKALIVSCSFVTSVTAFALSDDQYTKTLGSAATGASISSLINQEDQKIPQVIVLIQQQLRRQALLTLI